MPNNELPALNDVKRLLIAQAEQCGHLSSVMLCAISICMETGCSDREGVETLVAQALDELVNSGQLEPKAAKMEGVEEFMVYRRPTH